MRQPEKVSLNEFIAWAIECNDEVISDTLHHLRVRSCFLLNVAYIKSLAFSLQENRTCFSCYSKFLASSKYESHIFSYDSLQRICPFCQEPYLGSMEETNSSTFHGRSSVSSQKILRKVFVLSSVDSALLKYCGPKLIA